MEDRSEVIFMSTSIALAIGDYFTFSRNVDDETQVFLQIEREQVEPCEQGMLVCIPMDLWLVMHSAGVPSFELAKMSDEALRARAVRDVEGRLQQLYEAPTKAARISVSATRLAEFGSISGPHENQVDRQLEHLLAKREVQLQILKRSLEHKNGGFYLGFK
jgi:hypothetical protein